MKGKVRAAAFADSKQKYRHHLWGDSAPVSLSLIRKDLEKHLEKEAFYSAIIEVAYDGKKEKAILKALQRHPAKDFHAR